ncbi:MAG TPA: hypothetical protein VIK64_10900 [Anaerolineales bacterium]|jgi:hypothetical protein
MIRVTIIDTQQTISFFTNEATLLRLVAGCSVNPADLGELLIASDIYQPEIAAEIMSDLMEFDKTLRHKGPDFIHAAIEQAKAKNQAFEMTFQVIDDITKGEAFQSRECDLAVFDLPEQVIRTSRGLEITTSGEVSLNPEKRSSSPTVTYILPQDWVIENL